VQPANDDGLRAAPGTVWGELPFLAVAEGQHGRGLGAALLRVAEERYAADAAGRSASYYWTAPTDREYSVWAWRALDPERPVTAWAADPDQPPRARW
jgi:GNAT superfamily N-acetyltransferase